MKRLLSRLMVVSGLILLGTVLIPITFSGISYGLKPKLLDPTEVSQNPIFIASSVLGTSVDYTQASNWFSGTTTSTKISSKIGYYTLSIPAVKMQNISVQIDGQDLKKNAIQFPNTAPPGTFGNTVIFGHSTLAALYKPGDPISLFVPLLKVKKGDEITINYDGVVYRYVVRDTATVAPTKIEVLAQQFDKHELTLITCTPLGTYWKRFVVRAELVN
ncbi:MAG: sortase family protein [Candidatus Amesbacteria bacterium GW2011_GWA2_42_12]|uniref:Sortase family protein n=1 Tax=Candidatus Amesbacteria bacterium GW2011_GWA2_42_12 TaxID=1618356 RepID=A0A0G1ADI5_9BACT|nr:MAG: sortase family protein [Candidatus Amesbacteria bacterium GW2011_GWA2_42_12]